MRRRRRSFLRQLASRLRGKQAFIPLSDRRRLKKATPKTFTEAFDFLNFFMIIFLIGYMGCGKTTVGKPLAKALGLSFVDMDHYLTDTCRKTIPQLFEDLGEEGFRKLEHQTLEQLSRQDNLLIATGGGAPCFFQNMETMNRRGITLYLQVSPEGLAARLRHGCEKRPLLRGKSPEELLTFIRHALSQREEFYRQAQVTVACDGYSDSQVVEICRRAIQSMPG
ncbi:MAG: shikimate kinase [Rikenellaceae bacterium]|nr:shikimate kinase [Rikenellaceae bacterium]